MFDRKRVAAVAEVIRLAVALGVDAALVTAGVGGPLSSSVHWSLRIFSVFSLCLWGYILLRMIVGTSPKTIKKVE
jgi:hypothetical protein